MKPITLQSFIKSNKIRRQDLAIKAGYKTWEDYLLILKGEKAPKKSKIKEEKKTPPTKEKPTQILATDLVMKSKKHQFVIAFDVTGSMGAYRNEIRKSSIKLVEQLIKDNPHIEIGIVAFGDYCDIIKNDINTAIHMLPFSQDPERIKNFLDMTPDLSGGDYSEFYELVLSKIAHEFSWEVNSLKTMMFISDAPEHSVGYTYDNYYNDIDINDSINELKERNIKVDTFYVGSKIEFTAKLAAITGGVRLPYVTAEELEQVVYGATSVRSNKEAFMAYSMSDTVKMSSNLTGAYKTLTNIL